MSVDTLNNNRILEILENWNDYEIKKRKRMILFDCGERWEREYLIDKIHQHIPERSKEDILQAIYSCCRSISSPAPRDMFIKTVLRRLSS